MCAVVAPDLFDIYNISAHLERSLAELLPKFAYNSTSHSHSLIELTSHCVRVKHPGQVDDVTYIYVV